MGIAKVSRLKSPSSYQKMSSPNGDDSNTGTKDSPLKTLAAAQRVARINSDGSKDVTVVLRGGEYNISDIVYH